MDGNDVGEMIDDDGDDGSDNDDEGKGNSNNRYHDVISNHLFEIVPKIAIYLLLIWK